VLLILGLPTSLIVVRARADDDLVVISVDEDLETLK